MENKKTRKWIIYGILLSLFIPIVYNFEAYANRDRTLEEMITDSFVIIEEDGTSRIINLETIASKEKEISVADKYDIVTNIGGEVVETCDSKEEAIQTLNELEDEALKVEKFDATRSIKTGVVYINTYGVTEYYQPKIDVYGYTTGAYGVDAAYIGTVNGKIRVKYAGVIADFDPSDVNVVNYTSSSDVSYYMEEDGILRHYFYYGSSHSLASTRVGFDIPYLESDKKYYSYDGHYFYESYATMVEDYKKEVYTNAVNADTPYYNYYQFLSHRALSDFTGDDFDTISKQSMGTSSYETSKFKGIGKDFVKSQNEYTVNAMLMFGVAANESNWGRSSIAQDKNNLFGHGAVDSNPYWGANGYESPARSIDYHAYQFVSRGYLDYADWRYYGPHLGDKESGMNVKYASDPYWGEKAASRSYYLNEIPKEYGREKVGIITGVLNGYPLYKEPSTKSTVVEKIDDRTNLPVLIVDTIEAEGKTWYKIQSDTTLTKDRNDHDFSLIYNSSHDYLYVLANTVKIVHEGKVIEEPIEPVEPINPFSPGDVDGSGTIDPIDYVMVKNHIMQKNILTGDALNAADYDKSGEIDPIDYVMIKNFIMKSN